MNTLLGLLLLLMSCIGNAELWVILINRRHALPYHHSVLRKVRSLHDFGILLFPPFIIYVAGLRAGGLLVGGTLATLPVPVTGVLVITWIGFMLFVASALRWNLRRTPTRASTHPGRLINVAKEAGPEAVDDVRGETSKLAKLPMNQVWHLDVSRKTIRLTREQSAEQTIRIAHFSDMHLLDCPGESFHRRVADELVEMQPDFYAFTGDLLDDHKRLSLAVDIFSRLANVAPGYFILGNHDWHLDHELIRREIVATGWTDVAEKCLAVDHREAKIRIAGTETPWLGENPQVSARSDEDLRLLLSHAPDQRNFAVDNDFDLMLCGHNHGGQVVLPLIGPVYSPSRYGTRYAGGTFEHQNLLMHVSRGTGAKDTLRWNCPPEITLLEIQLPT